MASSLLLLRRSGLLSAPNCRVLGGTGAALGSKSCVPPAPWRQGWNLRGVIVIRGFATTNTNIKHQDQTLEGRYATALFRVATQQNALDKIYGDLDTLRTALQHCQDFKLFVETPGIISDQKSAVMKHIAQKYKFEATTVNFLTVLLENRRLGSLKKMVDAFEAFYRESKGEVKCTVTTAQELTSAQQNEVAAALQKRSGPKAKLIVEYAVSSALMGGMMVHLGEQVLDFSVATRLERLQTELMAPVE